MSTFVGVDEQRRLWAERLLEFPPRHPYAKYNGTHWRLVELADLGAGVGPERLRPAVEQVLEWITQPQSTHDVPPGPDGTRPRRHASQEGNILYACTVLGFGSDVRVSALVDVLLATQWPDGGWNCDRHQTARRSSFHETVTPAIGLAVFARTFDHEGAQAAAMRAAELLLDHRLYRRGGTGAPIHPSWTQLHYPPYWHYDILQGLRLVELLGLLEDERASDALELLRSLRCADGGYRSRRWSSPSQPGAVDYGRGTANVVLNARADQILAAAAAGGTQLT